MPKAVLWDIGNVMVRWNPRALYDKIFPDPVHCDRFLSSVCTTDWHIAHDLGISFAENRARLLRHPTKGLTGFRATGFPLADLRSRFRGFP
ncbi:MAG: hypothetical protein CGW95_13295 [Phenylobacterium zucineum]|nr:MAG: hypothetical protein CGW95_13295 [Phenylobacterium zucineum]